VTISNTHYQTSYGFQPAGIVGEIADRDGTEAEIERVNGEATSAIDFGTVVVRDSSAKETKCKRPAASTDEILGVAVVSGSVSADDSDDREFDAGDYTRILTRGKVWMEAAGTLAAGDTPWVVLSGADQGKVGPSSGGGTAPQVTLTWSKALAGGVPRVQTITLDADFVPGNTLNGTIGGQAFAVAFNTDHATTMGDMLTALRQELADSDQRASVALSDVAGDNRVVTVTSLGEEGKSATAQALASLAITGGASQANVTAADQQAGIAPASFSCTVDGDPIGPVEWSGTHDDTMKNIAAQLAGHSKVASAVVTIDEDAFDPTITLTGANKVADDIDVAAAAVTGGESTPATVAVDNEATPGVAATAMEWSQARVVKGGTDGDVIKVSIDVSPKP